MYLVTFINQRRTADYKLLQQVRVTADSPRAAWAAFEALYPVKHFLPLRSLLKVS